MFPYHNPKVDYNEMYPFDPQKANQLLDAAGFPRGRDGTRFTLRLISMASLPVHLPVVEIIRANLRDVGIAIRHEHLDTPILQNRVFRDHNFDLQLQTATAMSDPTLGVQRFYRGDEYGRGRMFVNASGYANPRVDALFQNAAATLNTNDRIRYFFEVQEIIARDLPVIHLIHNPNVDAQRKRVQGLWLGSSYLCWWDRVWVKE